MPPTYPAPSPPRPRGAMAMGEAIRSARRRMGLSLAALGDRIGSAARTIGRWENGKIIPPRKSRLRLVQVVAESDPSLGAKLAEALDVRRPEPAALQGKGRARLVDGGLAIAAEALGVPASRLSAAVWLLGLHLRQGGGTLEDVHARMVERMEEEAKAEG